MKMKLLLLVLPCISASAFGMQQSSHEVMSIGYILSDNVVTSPVINASLLVQTLPAQSRLSAELEEDAPVASIKKIACHHAGCGKTFTTRAHLKVHEIAAHSNGGKGYICSHEGCSKSYAYMGALRRHRLSHTDVVTFKCPNEGCSYATNQACNFERHRKACVFK